jgi:hypothetical protein
MGCCIIEMVTQLNPEETFASLRELQKQKRPIDDTFKLGK